MTCGDVTELAPLYLSGELDAARAAAFTAHLDTCGACAAEIEQQRELDARLRAGLLAEDGECAELEQRVRRRIAADSATRARLGMLAAGLAAVLLLAFWVNRGTPARLYTDAARDHHREIIDRQPRRWISDRAGIESLASSQQLPTSTIVSLAADGYRLEKGRICILDGRLFLHLVYTDGAQEVSLFLREGAQAPGTPQEIVNGKPIYAAGTGKDHVAAVESGRLTALLVATQSRDAALALARAAAAAL